MDSDGRALMSAVEANRALQAEQTEGKTQERELNEWKATVATLAIVFGHRIGDEQWVLEIPRHKLEVAHQAIQRSHTIQFIRGDDRVRIIVRRQG